MRKRLFWCALIGSICSAASAEDRVLLCTHEMTYDFQKGTMEDASGSFPFSIGYENGQIVDFTTPFTCGDGTVDSKVWGDELHISCFQISDDDLLHKFFKIDPASGNFVIILGDDSEEEVIHFGSCTTTGMRL